VETSTFVVSVVLSQARVAEMFHSDSFVVFTLSVKIQTPDKYKRWTILQQDAPSGKSKERKNNLNEKEEEEDDEGKESEMETETSTEIRLSDAMKKYYELPLSLPLDKFTETAIRSVAYMLKTGTDKYLNNVLTKEEMLETIALCDFLGLKTFVKRPR
jgi:hypothetical protein